MRAINRLAHRFPWILLLATLMPILPSCDALSPGTGGTGQFKLLVTDKPYPFEWITEATITVTRVDVRRAEGTESDAWSTVWEGQRELNLLDLRGGRTDLLVDANIDAGTYTQLRLIVTQGRVVIGQGDAQREFVLTVPSGEQTGIKLQLTFEVAEDQATTLLLDVDLSRAFRPIPAGDIQNVDSIREFQFTPSLAMRLITILQAGSISGTVTDSAGSPLANAAVTAMAGDEEVTTTATQADGTYALMGLPTGTYTVVFSATGFEDAQVAGVEVTAGATTANVNATLTASGG